ncbi:hypothetical protein GIB67_030347 [Kingdonia uniflora]|uniref:Uncharacterized protein n=1 Tax=Kingdonia uniflora TaxID=39325 RepID=A0A7J7M6Q0_9MAGN|nr:hypothetical protein GIB67_030347 [Kingdonia uniflora]
MDDTVRLIEFSSEDDCLIDSPSGPQESANEHEYFELLDVGNDEDSCMGRVQDPLFESPEPEKTAKTSKCNLRKSLAWDSAFFTSAGVLDPEELSVISNGARKSFVQPLPGIQEDLRRSEESNSSLDSDNLALESLEGDLFGDIRASMQMFKKGSDAMEGQIKGPGETGQSIQTSSKVEPTSQIRVPGRSGGLVTSLLKPPKIVGRINLTPPASTKSSLGVNRVKIESNKAKAATGSSERMVASRRPVSVDSSISSKSTPSPKSSSSSSTSTFVSKDLTASWSSQNKSDSISSDSTGRSPPIKGAKSKPVSRSVGPVSASVSASVSALKTPSRILLTRNKPDSLDSRISAYLISLPKPTSSLSPANSVDGWSSESSSTATPIQRSVSSAVAPDINSPRKGFSFKRDAPSIENGSRGTRLPSGPSQCTKRTSLGSGAAPRPQSTNGPQLPKKASLGFSAVPNTSSTNGPSQSTKKTSLVSAAGPHPASTNVSRSFKPSGLRMPSPKIGFFDAEKSLPGTPDGDMQFRPGAGNGLPRNGVGIGKVNGALTIKSKASKCQPARPVIGIRSVSLDSNQKLVDASPKMSPSSRTRDNCVAIISKIQINVPRYSSKVVSDCNRNNLSPSKFGEKENLVLSFENNVDSLSKRVGKAELNLEELNEKDNSSLSRFEHFSDPKLAISETRDFVHDLKEDCERISAKPLPLSPSPNIMETVPSTRIPLAVRETFPPEGIHQIGND